MVRHLAILLLVLALAAHARPPPPRILLYTPLHVSEPTDAVRAFAACLFGKTPSLRGLQFDVLVSVSGAQPDGRDAEVEEIISDAAHASKVAVTFTALQDDTYALALSNDHRKDAEWVSGPNAAFYGALLSGPVYDAHTRHYDLVQQLETDVCAMADGWLDVLVEPMLRGASILVSGARTACDCVYDAIHDVCEPMSKYGDHMLGHVNGNALYRVGRELRDVLTKAQAKYGNTEPFDLALYWTLKEEGMLSRLHTNPRYLNTPCLIDRARFTLPTYHAVPDAVAVHAPRRLRTTSVQAVASRGLNRSKQAQRKLHTLTVVALTRVDEDVLKHQQAAFASQFVDGVVYVAADRATYDAASRIAPLRVVAAFGDGGLDAGSRTQPGGSSSTINHHAPLLALEGWPPSTTHAGALMTAVARIINLGHDVFLVGLDAVPLANYGGKLAGLDRGVVHGAGVAESDGAASLPAMAYLPASNAVAAFANKWASMLRQEHILTHHLLADIAHDHGTALTHLPWSDFVVRGPFLASGWPSTTLKRRAVVAVGGGEALGSSSLTAFRHRAARVWPRTARVACANYSVLSRRPGNLTSVNVARVISRHAQFAAFVAANRVECAVVPGFTLPATRSRIDVGSVLDLTSFVRACGNTTLLPSSAWIEPGARRIKFTPKHSRGVVRPSLPLARPLQSAVRSVVLRLSPDFTCVRDPRRSPDEVASLTLGKGIDSWVNALRQQHGLSAHHQLLLTGAWKAVRTCDIVSADMAASLMTVADLVGDGLPHRLLTPILASTPSNPLLDPAWANVVEVWVCDSHAAVTVDAEPAFPPPRSLDSIINTILPHIPSSIFRRDMDALQRWRQRSDRLESLRPPIAVVGEDQALSSATTLRTLHTLADMQASRPIVIPFATKAWPDTAYIPPNILPPSVLALSLPRLAPVLASHGALSSAPDPQSSPVAALYPAEMALVKLLARRWAASVVWTAPGRLTLTEVLDAARAVPSRDAIWW